MSCGYVRPGSGDEPCSRHGVVLPDGSRGQCPRHGGINQLMSARGVSPSQRGVYYARFLGPDLVVDYLDAAVGDLEDDIRLAKARLTQWLRRQADAPDDVYYTNPTNGAITTYSDKIRELQEAVRRLEGSRAEMEAKKQDRPFDPHAIRQLVLKTLRGVKLDDGD